jgi:16S rRNA (uracil1498-N3)-methyltransferase
MARHDFRTPRLFVDKDLAADREIPLDRGQANYVRNVLRLAAGATVLVFNGRDGEWRGRLKGSGRHASLVIESRVRAQTAPGDLALAFAPLKHARLDYAVQKSVEMGVTSLAPVFTQHTQATRVNLERLRANAIEAAEQCGILSIPAIANPQPFGHWLAGLVPERVLVFCDEESDVADPLAALAQAPRGPITVLIGPEGGFAESERQAVLARSRVLRLSLGPRVLRADTAAIAALALVQAVHGDWR